MVDRRAFIANTIGLLAVPLGAGGQSADSVPTVVLVAFTPANRDALVAGLEGLGYQEGRTVVIDWRRPGPSGNAPPYLGDMGRLKPTCLLLAGPSNLAAGRKLGTTIPIIAIDLESDPVQSGFVASLARPGGSVTGIFLDLPELAGKQIQLLREAIPTLTRLAVLFDERFGGTQLRAAHIAARAAGVSLDPIAVRTADDLDDVIPRAMKSRAQAFLVLTGPIFFPNLGRIATSAQRHQLPSASIFPAMAEAVACSATGRTKGSSSGRQRGVLTGS